TVFISNLFRRLHAFVQTIDAGDARHLRTRIENSPSGRAIKMPTTATSVSTFAIEPLRKKPRIDCACAIENAEANVPIRLPAPPNTTTRKVSTMYSEPDVGPVDAMVV